jgi:hypothetical protein
MDPFTISAVLIALVGGIGSGVGTSLWTGLGSLVQRPFRHHRDEGSAPAAAPAPASGERELAALQQAPADKVRALALAQVLVGRGKADPEFQQALQAWWDQAEPIRQSVANNTISGGTFYGNVFQAGTITGTTVTGPTFGSQAVPPPPGPSGPSPAGA